MAVTNIEALCLKAQEAIGQRDWEQAKIHYQHALEIKFEVPDIHYGLATVFYQLRELTGAAHHFREATRLDPLHAGAYVNLGAVLNLLGEYDEALTVLRRSLQLDPKRVEAYYNLGLVYRRKGQLDLAVQAYREALRLNPRMADALLNLGNIFFEKDQYRHAMTYYQQAAKLRPGWEKADDGLEQARLALEEEQEANKPIVKPVAPPKMTTANLERLVDPVAHHKFLTRLHEATQDAEEKGGALEQVLANEIEPAIKELSGCLLFPNGTRSELEEHIVRVENAMKQMQHLQKQLQQSVARVKSCGDQLPVN